MMPPPESAERPDTAAGATVSVRVLLVLIRGYQLLLSPLLGGNCRYHPTCSAYAREALLGHGLWRGGRLALRRISRCHPWGGHGHDPVPAPQNPKLTRKQAR